MKNSRTGLKSLIVAAIVAPILLTLTACSGAPVHYYQPSDFATSASGSVSPITPNPQPTASAATIVPQEATASAKATASKIAESLKEKAERLAKAIKDKAVSKGEQTNAQPAGTASGAKAKALKQLAGLKVQEANYGVKYNRTKDFGQAWYDYDHNGCDTRNDVLKRDLSRIIYKSNDYGCTIATGVLKDPYTGNTINFTRGQSTSMAIQIDHIAPLHYVWMHGGYTWSADKRLRYANDQVNVLIAADGPANMVKGDKGPADWMPSNSAYRCTYVEKFTNALATYGATISRRDAAQVKSVLATCK
jgi:hypothetical protein